MRQKQSSASLRAVYSCIASSGQRFYLGLDALAGEKVIEFSSLEEDQVIVASTNLRINERLGFTTES